jgi:hypothetical protein
LINKKELNKEIKQINKFRKKLERSYRKSPSLYFIRCVVYFLEILSFPYFLEKIFSNFLSSDIIGYTIGFVITLGIFKFAKIFNITIFKGITIFYITKTKVFNSLLQSLGVLSALIFINFLLEYDLPNYHVKEK